MTKMTDPKICGELPSSKIYFGWSEMKWKFVGEITLNNVTRREACPVPGDSVTINFPSEGAGNLSHKVPSNFRHHPSPIHLHHHVPLNPCKYFMLYRTLVVYHIKYPNIIYRTSTKSAGEKENPGRKSDLENRK